jgi:hypothetical protein
MSLTFYVEWTPRFLLFASFIYAFGYLTVIVFFSCSIERSGRRDFGKGRRMGA